MKINRVIAFFSPNKNYIVAILSTKFCDYNIFWMSIHFNAEYGKKKDKHKCILIFFILSLWNEMSVSDTNIKLHFFWRFQINLFTIYLHTIHVNCIKIQWLHSKGDNCAHVSKKKNKKNSKIQNKNTSLFFL